MTTTDTSTASTTLVQRPAGLAYTPPGTTKPYDWHTDIPTNALDAKDFSSIDAWLDACIAQNRPGKIGSGTYEVSGTARYAPQGIYGYGDTAPKFVAAKTDCWLYLKDQTVTLKGLAFEGFGQVIGGAVKLTDGHPYHSTTDYGFSRFQPQGEGGTGLALQVKASTDTVGPGLNVSDCSFTNDESVFEFVSDTTQMGAIHFDRNVLTGTYGILNVNSLYWTEVDAANNEWKNATGARVEPNVKANGLGTGFKIGVNAETPDNNHYTKLSLVNNWAHDIQSVTTFDNTNAAVFADVRGAFAKNVGDNVISYNKIERVQGLRGQEDSNAIYAKAWGLKVEGNYIAQSGAAYYDDKHNGSETTGVLVKPTRDAVAKDIQINGNTFVDMPVVPNGVTPDLSVVKVSEAIGNSSISFNTFIRGGNTSNGQPADGVIRWYGNYENVKVVGNNFNDVKFGTNDNAIVFHQLTADGVGQIEVAQNTASKANGDYTADQQLIAFDTKPHVLLAANNTLDGGHWMKMSLAPTGVAPTETYSPQMVSLSGSTASLPSSGDTTSGSTGATSGSTTGSTTGSTGSTTGTTTGSTTGSTVTSTGAVASAAPTHTVNGASGADSVTGTDANDKIDGGSGADTMAGGKGDDTYVLSGYKDVIVEQASSGVDTAQLYDTHYVLPANVENLVALSGKPTLLVGNELANILQGGAVGDTLVGGAGNDVLIGGGGNDVFLIGPGDGADQINDFNAGDHVFISGSQFASFQAMTSAMTQSGSDVLLKLDGGSSLTLKNVKIADLTAAQFGFTNMVTTATDTAAWTTVRGGGTSGADLIGGTDQADYIDGKGGADILVGGKGDDTYVVYSPQTHVIENPGEGVDRVLIKTSSYALDPYVENATVSLSTGVKVFGNAEANIIIGGDGADTITGGGGADRLTGGKGADVFVYNHVGDAGDLITDFTPGVDKLNLTALKAETGGTISTAAVSDGLGVYLTVGSVKTLIVDLKGVSSLYSGDLVA